MFKYTVEYLVSFGAMCIHTKFFKCRAWCKFGAWVKFVKGTVGEDHYSDSSYIHNYFRVRKDIRRGWHDTAL